MAQGSCSICECLYASDKCLLTDVDEILNQESFQSDNYYNLMEEDLLNGDEFNIDKDIKYFGTNLDQWLFVEDTKNNIEFEGLSLSEACEYIDYLNEVETICTRLQTIETDMKMNDMIDRTTQALTTSFSISEQPVNFQEGYQKAVPAIDFEEFKCPFNLEDVNMQTWPQTSDI